MDELKQRIAAQKAELDRQRGRVPRGLANFEHSQDLELTYTSNAIEGNTLTAVETALVVEKGVTIGGKPLKDHLEAVDHFGALRYVRELAQDPRPLGESDVRNLHRLVMLRNDPEGGGGYAETGRFVLTDSGRHAFPSPVEIPARMGTFAQWLGAAPMVPETAFDAHRDLVSIHPFADGNGRTARLLMNLVLIRGGYPPVSIRPDDRAQYLDTLRQADQGNKASFDLLLYRRLDATLGEYVSASRQALTPLSTPGTGGKPQP